MNDRERKINKFSKNWFARGGEKGDTQKFWLALLRDVLEIEEPENIIDFEKYVIIDDQKKYIDGYIARTKVLIEQKSFGKDLDKTYQQSDDENLTPLEQAERYADYLPFSEQPRWIITCNFSEFRIYDRLQMKNPTLYLSQGETYKPTIYKLQDFRYVYKNLKFLVDPIADELKPEIKISKAAANIIKVIYEAFEKNYSRLHIKDYKNFLDKLCTRLVFCFYAGDALIFNDNQFFKYIAKFATETERIEALQNIFDVLNTPEENRSQNLDNDLKNFPYVNGGLFGDKISLPAFNNIEGNFTETISLANIEDKLNWRKISPPIFGAMFESILNEETRREGGMYYTTP
ncbi:MAG: hypothetical protein IKN27_14640, partial [Selenomonadaceae bacterium]|nr:hypothetical protein [Selenomonadaceae bacterium]